MTKQDRLPSLWRTTLSAWTLALEGDKDQLSPRTIRVYRDGATEWILNCEDRGVDPLTATKQDVRGWIAHQRAAGAGASTIATRVAGARRLNKWLASEGDISQSPFDGIGRIKVPEPETPVMSDNDIRKLFKACEGTGFLDRRDNAIVRLLIDTGIRRAECAGILLSDLDLDNRQLVVRGKSKPGEGAHIRILPFGEKCGIAIVRYLRTRATHPRAEQPYLWLSHNPRPPTGELIRKVADKRAKLAEVAFRPHLGRHKWADGLYRNNVSDRDVDRLAGWRDPRTGARYGRALQQERAVEKARALALGDKL